jgi:hypothetical protein
VIPIFSFNEQRICINCKHFKKDFWSENKFGKCALFPIEKNNKDYLVDGKTIRPNNNNFYCSTARGFDSMCGETGKLFSKKNG